MGNNISSLSGEALQRYIAEQLTAIRHATERAAVDQMLWATFPEDGGYEPLPAGLTTIDIKTGKVSSPDKTRKLSAEATQFLTRVQSAFFFVDSLVTMQLIPGVGQYVLACNSPAFGSGRVFERVELNASYPFNTIMLFGTHLYPPSVHYVSMPYFRYSDTTLTKAKATNDTEDWTDLSFVPRYAAKSLDQTLYGKPELITFALGQKSAIVRNLSAYTIEVRVVRAVYLAIALSVGFILDTDVHAPGSSYASLVSIGALTNATLETGLPGEALKIQARLNSAVAAGSTARVIVEFTGLLPSLR